MTPTQLMDALTAGSGEIHIPDPNERVRASYRRAIHAAKERRLVPEGFQLWHTGRDRGDMTIRLLRRHGQVQGQPHDSVQPPQPEPPRPRAQTAERKPKRKSLDVKPALPSLAVSKPLIPRCRAILQSLADEALRRGYDVLVGVEKASLVIVASGEHLPFKLFEELDVVAAPPPKKPEPLRYSRQQPPPITVRVPSGRLTLRLEHHYRNRTWADRVRWRVEDRVIDVIDHVDCLARAEIERQREAHEKGLRDLEEWEAAVVAARRDFLVAMNRRRMRQQAARSARAQTLRAFADRVAVASLAESNVDLKGRMLDWQAQIADQADNLDPLNSPEDLGPIEPQEIGPTQLAPYMPRGMSVYYRPTVPAFPHPAGLSDDKSASLAVTPPGCN